MFIRHVNLPAATGAAIVCLAVALGLGTPALAATLGFVDTFPANGGVNGWAGGQVGMVIDNPNSGGVGGNNDGFLRLTQPTSQNFGARTSNTPYTGDWTAAGINMVTFFLNDIGTAQPFQIHFLIADGAQNIWQNTIGFTPPHGAWRQFSVDLTNPAVWQEINGTATFASVLANVDRAHFRHDLAPFVFSPDGIAGDLGIDNVALIKEIPGDANHDGRVTVGDLGILAQNFGLASGAFWEQGDFNGDRKVDVGDLGILAAHYGQTVAAIPEPASLALLAAGLLALRRRAGT